MRLQIWFLVAILSAGFAASVRADVPDSCRQLIVAVGNGWDARSGEMRRFERTRGKWIEVGDPFRVLFGLSGLAWGVGAFDTQRNGPVKREGDRRAPAGLFEIGRAFGDAEALPFPAMVEYVTVTPADAWIEDSSHPLYNRHVRVDLSNPPPWFRAAQMRQNDPAHRWKLEIRHNADDPIPGRGSAIFFHIWRSPERPTAGCTTMAEHSLLELIRWIDPSANPYYALLPVDEYRTLERDWNLPPLRFGE